MVRAPAELVSSSPTHTRRGGASSYKYFVTATNKAGNKAAVASAKLTVK